MGPIVVADRPSRPLRALAGMTADDFSRTYGLLYLDPKLSKEGARTWAIRLLQQAAGRPLALAGTHVREAFRVPYMAIELVQTCWLLDLPIVTDPAEARRRLWLAVDLWRHPIGPYRRDYCSQCLKLTEVHPTHPNDKSLRVMCPGETMRFCYPLTRSD